MTGESVWKFRRGDAVISGIPAEPIQWGVAVRGSRYLQRHAMFGADSHPTSAATWRSHGRVRLPPAPAGASGRAARRRRCGRRHLATEVAWPHKRAGGAQRYTLSLGLRPSDAPDLAGPRNGAKYFAELDLAKRKPITFDFASLDMKLPLVVTTATCHWAIAVDSSGKSYVLSKPSAEGAVGGATPLLMRLASQADKDLGIKVVLNRPVMSRIHGEAWPDASTKDKGTYFAGYHRAIGQYGQPPDHEDGVLLLSAGKPPALSKLIADNAGYNFGLVGLEYQATIQAGKTLVVPVLVV